MDRRAFIDERIRNLLISTDLTFKQIIETLKLENISASFNTIRRVNRNHRYRKPRYDAKLTPQQRKELIIKLKNTSKPNLSSLAKQYGVCHGSIWYWWDKLSKIREKNNGIVPQDEPSLEFDDIVEQEYMSQGNGCMMTFAASAKEDTANYLDHGQGDDDDDDDDDLIADPESDPLDLSEEEGFVVTSVKKQQELKDYLGCCSSSNQDNNDGDVEMIGAVRAKDWTGKFIEIPILMYAPVANQKDRQSTSKSIVTGPSSSVHSTPTTTSASNYGESSGSLCKRLKVS